MADVWRPALWAKTEAPDERLLGIGGDVDQLRDVVGHRGEQGQPVGRDGGDPQLEREVGYDGGQVGVARPLAVAVDAPLDVGGADRHAGQRVGHRAATVVVEVDPDLGLEAVEHGAHDPLHLVGQGSAVGVAQDQRLGAGLLGRLEDAEGELRDWPCSRRRSARRRGTPAGRWPAGRRPSRPPWRPPRRAWCATRRPRGSPRTWPRCRRPRSGPRPGGGGSRRPRPGRRPAAWNRRPPAWHGPGGAPSGARAKNSASFGLAPGQPPSMKVTPRWSSCSATRSLSSTVSERPSCWEPSRRVVSKTSTAVGRSGRAKSWPPAGRRVLGVLVLVVVVRARARGAGGRVRGPPARPSADGCARARRRADGVRVAVAVAGPPTRPGPPRTTRRRAWGRHST